MAALPTRRVVLAAGATLPLAAMAGCGGVDVLAAPPRPAPDVEVLRSAIAAEQLMIARYAAVLRDGSGSARPAGGGSPATMSADLDRLLAPLLAQHKAHLAQLRSRLIVPAGSRAAGPPPSGHSPGTPTVPAAPAAAVAFLRAAEQAAATAMLNRLPHAPAPVAQLFASISASEATHVPVLDAALRAAG